MQENGFDLVLIKDTSSYQGYLVDGGVVTTGVGIRYHRYYYPSISMRPNGPDTIGQWTSPERLSSHTNAGGMLD